MLWEMVSGFAKLGKRSQVRVMVLVEWPGSGQGDYVPPLYFTLGLENWSLDGKGGGVDKSKHGDCGKIDSVKDYKLAEADDGVS